jgi:predicted nucleotidyltransferase
VSRLVLAVEVLRPRLREYFERVPQVSFAILFGSAARGDVSAKSDLDIAVMLGDGGPLYLDRDGEVREAFPDIGRYAMVADPMGLCDTDRVDLVFLNNAAPLMQHRVLRDSVVLFARDSAALAKFTTGRFSSTWTPSLCVTCSTSH